jgi:hypothetical protein
MVIDDPRKVGIALTDNAFLGAMTAGALVVTVLVACYAMLWQGIKDVETGVVLTILSIGILALMDPLVLNWLPLLVPKGVPATNEVCAQLSAWRKGLEMGTYSLPVFAAFCTARIAEWDWKVAQWLYRLQLGPQNVTEPQPKMAAFTRSKGWRGVARAVLIFVAVALLYRIADLVNPAGCKSMP